MNHGGWQPVRGLLDFIGQVKPTIDNHSTHHQAERKTVFLEGFTLGGIVAFFETFFHHGQASVTLKTLVRFGRTARHRRCADSSVSLSILATNSFPR